jgi:hypothetical protein
MPISDQEAELLELEGAPLDAEDEAYTEDGVGFALPDNLEECQLLEALYKDLIRGEHAKEIHAEAEMRRVIEASKSLGEPGFCDGIGQLMARVPAKIFHHWGLRYGYEIWNNPQDLIRFLDQRNPGFMVRSRQSKHVVVQGRRDDHPAIKPGDRKYLLPAEDAGSCGDHRNDGAAARVRRAAVSAFPLPAAAGPGSVAQPSLRLT